MPRRYLTLDPTEQDAAATSSPCSRLPRACRTELCVLAGSFASLRGLGLPKAISPAAMAEPLVAETTSGGRAASLGRLLSQVRIERSTGDQTKRIAENNAKGIAGALCQSRESADDRRDWAPAEGEPDACRNNHPGSCVIAVRHGGDHDQGADAVVDPCHGYGRMDRERARAVVLLFEIACAHGRIFIPAKGRYGCGCRFQSCEHCAQSPTVRARSGPSERSDCGQSSVALSLASAAWRSSSVPP